MSAFKLSNVFKSITTTAAIQARNPIIELDEASVIEAGLLVGAVKAKSSVKVKALGEQALIHNLATLTFNGTNASNLAKGLQGNIKESYSELMNSPKAGELFAKLIDALWLLDRSNAMQVNAAGKNELLAIAEKELSDTDYKLFKGLKQFTNKTTTKKAKQFTSYQTATRYISSIQKDLFSEDGGLGFVMKWDDSKCLCGFEAKKFEPKEDVCQMAKLAKQISGTSTDINLLISIMAATPEFLATARAMQKQLDVIIPNAEKAASVQAQKTKDQLQATTTQANKKELEDPTLKNNITAQLTQWDEAINKSGLIKDMSMASLSNPPTPAGHYKALLSIRAMSSTSVKQCKRIDALTSQYQDITKGLPLSIAH